MNKMNAGHGPVVAVIQSPWDVYEAQQDSDRFVGPMLVTADGTMWELKSGAWVPITYSITESLGYDQQKETTP
jgi:hypothetical protein